MTRCCIAGMLLVTLHCRAQTGAWPGFPSPGYKHETQGRFFNEHINGTVRAILQAKNGDMWLGTDAEGVYHFDGQRLAHFTVKDGRPGNQVFQVQEDSKGTIWIETSRGICHYDGALFVRQEVNASADAMLYAAKYTPGKSAEDIWFSASNGAYHYDGHTLRAVPLWPGSSNSDPHPGAGRYAVYCTYKDKAGVLWMGTQTDGVARREGSTLTYVNGKGLSGPAVRAIFQDSKGVMWFGNNGGGLFRYDGHTLVNLTEQYKLGNPDFLRGKMVDGDRPGTLARVWSVAEDNSGTLWIGTIDAGVWRYDGEKLVNYSTKDGLPGNEVHVIYKDQEGTMWFGTSKGVCRYLGGKFVAAPF